VKLSSTVLLDDKHSSGPGLLFRRTWLGGLIELTFLFVLGKRCHTQGSEA